MKLHQITNLFSRAAQVTSQNLKEPLLLKSPSDYKPTLYLSHPFLQSIYTLAEPKIKLDLLKERIFLEDGGHVSLNWLLKEKPQKAL